MTPSATSKRPSDVASIPPTPFKPLESGGNDFIRGALDCACRQEGRANIVGGKTAYPNTDGDEVK